MTKDELKALGLDEATAEKVATASKKELEGYVTQADYKALETQNTELTGQIKTRDTQLTKLKNSTGNIEELQKQITNLQTENKTAKADYDSKIKDLKFTAAIKMAIADKAQDVDLVAGLFDKSKMILGDDGKITGLDEQVKVLQESKSFLFKSSTTPEYNPNAGNKNNAAKNPFAKDTFNLTEQGKLLKENPAQAKVFAAEAGVTI